MRRVCASGGAHSKALPPTAGREMRATVAAGEATRCAVVEARTGAGAAAVGASYSDQIGGECLRGVVGAGWKVLARPAGGERGGGLGEGWLSHPPRVMPLSGVSLPAEC